MANIRYSGLEVNTSNDVMCMTDVTSTVIQWRHTWLNDVPCTVIQWRHMHDWMTSRVQWYSDVIYLTEWRHVDSDTVTSYAMTGWRHVYSDTVTSYACVNEVTCTVMQWRHMQWLNDVTLTVIQWRHVPDWMTSRVHWYSDVIYMTEWRHVYTDTVTSYTWLNDITCTLIQCRHLHDWMTSRVHWYSDVIYKTEWRHVYTNRVTSYAWLNDVTCTLIQWRHMYDWITSANRTASRSLSTSTQEIKQSMLWWRLVAPVTCAGLVAEPYWIPGGSLHSVTARVRHSKRAAGPRERIQAPWERKCILSVFEGVISRWRYEWDGDGRSTFVIVHKN